MRSKKATYMISFLVTVLLAIIIFAPSCAFASKFFRLSTQAKDNFASFVVNVEDLQKTGKEGQRQNNLLILDKETVFAYFEEAELRVEVDSKSYQDYSIFIERPLECIDNPKAQSCFCLFREVDTESSFTEKLVMIKPVKKLCKPEEFKVMFSPSDNCGVGIAHDVGSYKCNGGFFIDREVVSDADAVQSYYKNGRRVNIVMEKIPNGIKMGEK